MIAIRAVVFDLDGTLVDLERFHHEAHLRAAREAGLDLTWQQALRRLPHFIGGPDERVASEIADLSGRPEVAAADVLAAKRRYFTAQIEAVDRIVPRVGAGDVLDRVLARGLPVAVGTVTDRVTTLEIMERAGLLALVGENRVVTADDVPRLKPAPHVYLETARRLGVAAAQQLVFEDSFTGVTAARSASSTVVGMPTVGDRDYLLSIVEAGVSAVFTDWRDPDLLDLVDRLCLGGRVPHA